jgi:hypothetical protein
MFNEYLTYSFSFITCYYALILAAYNNIIQRKEKCKSIINNNILTINNHYFYSNGLLAYLYGGL